MIRFLIAVAALFAAAALAGASAASPEAVQFCSDQFDQLMAAHKLAGEVTRDSFVKACAAQRDAPPPPPKATAPATGAPANGTGAGQGAPAAPAPGTKPQAADKAGDKASDKPKFQSRMKACATQWDDLKAKGQNPEPADWPGFWHACIAKLKEAGQ